MPELSGQGPAALPGGTSVVFTTPFPLVVGQQARGLDGSVYLFVDYTGTVYSGLPVAILSDNTAGPLGITHRGRIGVCMAQASSDNAGWVQIYGRCDMQVGVAGTSPSDAANCGTTLQTSAGTKFILATSATTLNVLAFVSDASGLDEKYVVTGITMASDPSLTAVSDLSSAASHTGSHVGVFLNFPAVNYSATNITS